MIEVYRFKKALIRTVICFCTSLMNSAQFSVASHEKKILLFSIVFISIYRMESIIEIRRISAPLRSGVFLGLCLKSNDGKSVKLVI